MVNRSSDSAATLPGRKGQAQARQAQQARDWSVAYRAERAIELGELVLREAATLVRLDSARGIAPTLDTRGMQLLGTAAALLAPQGLA